MYTQLRDSLQRAGAPAAERRRRYALPRVSSTVLALGVTSLFTDISSESVSSVLPLYFLVALRFTPFAFGFIDGLNQGAAALVSLFSGVVSDRWQRHKAVATSGYALSAVTRLGLLVVGGNWPALVGVIGVDRLGKGIRTAPRDAMIALSSNPETLGVAFGVHRALDTLGALIGPILAFAILDHTANAFDSVFVVSCCAAILGLAVIVLFVRGDRTAARPESAGTAARRRQAVSPRAMQAMLLEPRFGGLVLVATALSLTTISDGFLYLVLQRGLHISLGFFPLLYVGTSLSYFVLAVPAGWLADRIGAARVFVGGYALLLLVYTAVLRGGFGTVAVFGYLFVFGAYYAATDGVLRAHASTLLSPALRTSGLGLLTTATSLASLLGSVLFGAIWTWRGQHTAVVCFFIALCLAALAAVLHFALTTQHATDESELRHAG